MAPILSALPILLGTGALRRPACQGGYASVLHIARRVKPDVFNMAVSKPLSHTPFRSLRTLSSKATSVGRTNSRPQFVSKGPPINFGNYWVIFGIGLMIAFVDGGVRAIGSKRKRAKAAVEDSNNLGLQMTDGATGEASNHPF